MLLSRYGLELPPRLLDLDMAASSDNMEPFQSRELDVSNNKSSSFTNVQTFSNVNGQTNQSSNINQQTMSKDENNNTIIEKKMQKSKHKNGEVVLNESMHYQLGTGQNKKPYVKVFNSDGAELEMQYLKETSPEKQSQEALAFVEKARPMEKRKRQVSDEQHTTSAAAGNELMAISEHMNRYFNNESNTSSQSSVSKRDAKSSAKSKTTTNTRTRKQSAKRKSSTSQNAVKSTATKRKTTTSTAKKPAKSKPPTSQRAQKKPNDSKK